MRQGSTQQPHIVILELINSQAQSSHSLGADEKQGQVLTVGRRQAAFLQAVGGEDAR